MNLNKLSLLEKFGQMLIIGLDAYEINEEIIDIIQKYKIGGVVLYKKNYTSIETMEEVINKLKQANKDNKIPLFIAIDQENGRVNRFPKEILTMPSAGKIGNNNSLEINLAISEITAYLLKQVGVNMNLAPVLDINHSDKNKVIGNRSYGSTKEEIIKYAIPFMQTMQQNNIISVIKHFPGHGLTNKDTHVIIPKIKKLKQEDINVFYEAINNGADVIMSGHLRIKGYGLKPATLNKKFIHDYLNKYNGLLITDDLRMGIIPYIFKLHKSILKSIEAGHNLVMFKYKKGDSNKLFKTLEKMVRYCEIDPVDINNSAKKIINIKKKYLINDNLLNNDINIKVINNKIKKINSICNQRKGVYL